MQIHCELLRPRTELKPRRERDRLFDHATEDRRLHNRTVMHFRKELSFIDCFSVERTQELGHFVVPTGIRSLNERGSATLSL